MFEGERYKKDKTKYQIEKEVGNGIRLRNKEMTKDELDNVPRQEMRKVDKDKVVVMKKDKIEVDKEERKGK